MRDDEITRLKALVASLERRVQEDGVIIDGLKAVAREKERLERALAEEKETSAKRYQALVAEARKVTGGRLDGGGGEEGRGRLVRGSTGVWSCCRLFTG